MSVEAIALITHTKKYSNEVLSKMNRIVLYSVVSKVTRQSYAYACEYYMY
jgi:hypothetical protein